MLKKAKRTLKYLELVSVTVIYTVFWSYGKKVEPVWKMTSLLNIQRIAVVSAHQSAFPIYMLQEGRPFLSLASSKQHWEQTYGPVCALQQSRGSINMWFHLWLVSSHQNIIPSLVEPQSMTTITLVQVVRGGKKAKSWKKGHQYPDFLDAITLLLRPSS